MGVKLRNNNNEREDNCRKPPAATQTMGNTRSIQSSEKLDNGTAQGRKKKKKKPSKAKEQR